MDAAGFAPIREREASELGVDQGHWRCVAGCLQVEAGLDVPRVVLAAVSVLLVGACSLSKPTVCVVAPNEIGSEEERVLLWSRCLWSRLWNCSGGRREKKFPREFPQI